MWLTSTTAGLDEDILAQAWEEVPTAGVYCLSLKGARSVSEAFEYVKG